MKAPVSRMASTLALAAFSFVVGWRDGELLRDP